MARLTAKQRNALPASAFAIPAERAYPLTNAEGEPDPAHAADAKARAAGTGAKNLSAHMTDVINTKANKVLGKW
jgi:hypothetical protein